MVIQKEIDFIKAFITNKGNLKATMVNQKLSSRDGVLFAYGEKNIVAQFYGNFLVINCTKTSKTILKVREMLAELFEAQTLMAYQCSFNSENMYSYFRLMMTNENNYIKYKNNIEICYHLQLVSFSKTGFAILNCNDYQKALEYYKFYINYYRAKGLVNSINNAVNSFYNLKVGTTIKNFVIDNHFDFKNKEGVLVFVPYDKNETGTIIVNKHDNDSNNQD